MNRSPLYDPHARTLALLGELTQAAIDESLDRLLRFHCDHRNKNQPITLYLSSSGGTIPQFTRLYDVLAVLRAPVITIGLGPVSGIGSLLLACGTRQKRWVLKHTLIHTHGIIDAVDALPPNPITLAFQGSTPREKGRAILRGQLLEILQKDLKLEDPFIAALQKGGTVYTAEEAVKAGLADQVHSLTPNP